MTEQTINERIQQQKEENEKIKNKLFCIENVIIKKDNKIQHLNKKLVKFNENEESRYLSYVEKEIMITEPTIAINQMFNELNSFKEINENLIKHINDSRYSIQKHKNIINV